MFVELKKSLLVWFSLILFSILSIWWVTMFARHLTDGVENKIYTLCYPFLSLLGGIIGVMAARKWGGMKSSFGKGIYFLAFGLLAQFFGQFMYAYYIYIAGIEVPYPSWGDLGYFGSVILYIFAVLFLGRVAGMHVNLRTINGKLQAFLLPAIILAASYYFFLRDYTFEQSQPLKIFLDFGYPLGQALYVSLAILVLLLSRNVLGGLMRKPMLLLILALAVQYFCDFMFLYQASRGTWYVGGVNDFLYSLSYFLMTVALTYSGLMYTRVKES